MADLEKAFTQELLDKCAQAERACGYNPARLVQALTKYGGVRAAKELLRRNGASDGFTRLQTCGRLDLTLEATVADRKYAELFTDDEVNACFALLCEYGFFG